MTTNAFFSLGTKALVADGSPGARAELVRRGRDPETGKKVASEGKAKAKAAASPAPAPEPDSGERLFASLSGLERHRALKGMAESLGLDASGKSNAIEARIRAAQAQGSAPAQESAPTGEVDVEAVVKGVQRLADAFLAQRAEIARLKAQAKPAASGGDWLKSVASALKSTGHLSA